MTPFLSPCYFNPCNFIISLSTAIILVSSKESSQKQFDCCVFYQICSNIAEACGVKARDDTAEGAITASRATDIINPL